MSQDHPPHIFVSVGHELTSHQRYFVDAIDTLLQTQGYMPVTIGRTTEAMAHPLAVIHDVMVAARGTIIIAFARLAVQTAVEYPAASFARPITDRTLPTVWNQIEAAMAAQAQLPLLLLCQEELHFEGIIDPQVHAIVSFPAPITSELPENICHAMLEWLTHSVR
ncbi:MAG: hypothetical protein H0X24_21445 [Ktedonobacterales bacterium]|nr:hypothetical protein [Ktedonobacterales bacterium]